MLGRAIFGCFLAASALLAYHGSDPPLVLYDDGRVLAQIIAPNQPSAIKRVAVQNLVDTVRQVWGFELPVREAGLVSDWSGAIVIQRDPRLKALGPEGFEIRRVDEPQGFYLRIASAGASGIFHGVQYLADFLIQSRGGLVFAKTAQVVRRPAIGLRGTYNLVCWGLAPRYTRQHWEKVLDAMAEDGMNFIYFWLAGVFRSKLHPETFIYPETPLTTEDIRQLIRYAHGKGIDFYLGTGVFAWFGVDEMAKYNADYREVGVQHMCRTLPAARKAMKSYLMELFDIFPEAKGMWLEIGCEGDYHCQGTQCQRKVDEFGSRQIALSELSFLKEFSTELWNKHPHAKLVWGMGYPEAHRWDVKYYDEIRRNFTDPRYYFLEVRQNWALQDQDGVLRPLRHLSPNTMHWDQYYALPLRDLGERARRIHEDGLAGWAVAFEPGFNTNSVYGSRIPFPVDLIPYRLTRFAYKEYTWEPALSWEGFRKRLLEHFFGEGANPELVDLTLTLFEFMRTGPIRGRFSELTKPSEGAGEYANMLKPRLAAIEARLNGMESSLGARAKQFGLPLLRQTITDLRAAYNVK